MVMSSANVEMFSWNIWDKFPQNGSQGVFITAYDVSNLYSISCVHFLLQCSNAFYNLKVYYLIQNGWEENVQILLFIMLYHFYFKLHCFKAGDFFQHPQTVLCSLFIFNILLNKYFNVQIMCFLFDRVLTSVRHKGCWYWKPASNQMRFHSTEMRLHLIRWLWWRLYRLKC